MTINIGTVETEVSVEPQPSAPAEGALQGAEWKEQVRIAALRARLLRDELRTGSTSYDD